MGIFEVRGGRINRRYLERKSKFDLCSMYLDLLDQFEKVRARADLAAERERELLKQAADCVPTTWLDPLITGPNAVNLGDADNREVEALLRGIQDRIRALATHNTEVHQRRESKEGDVP